MSGVVRRQLHVRRGALDDRTVFLDVRHFGDTPSKLASLIADHPRLVGLTVGGFADYPAGACTLMSEDPYDALSGLEHLEWLHAWHGEYTHAASTLRRLSTLKELRHLGLQWARAADLAPLDALVKLRRLRVMLEDGSGDWRPQLPELRTLEVQQFGGANPWLMLDLSGCPQLASLAVGWVGNADTILDEAASLPRLRELHMGPAWVSAASIDRLATFVRLRRLSLSGHLEVPDGLLRHLGTLTALESLRAGIVGANADDVDWLAERLPSTSLNLPIYTKLGEFVYQNDREYERLKGWLKGSGADKVAEIVWVDH